MVPVKERAEDGKGKGRDKKMTCGLREGIEYGGGREGTHDWGE